MKKYFTLMMATFALFWLAACSLESGSSSTTPAASSQTAQSGDKTIGMSISTLNNPFFVTLGDSAKTKAAALGASLTVVDAQNDASKQAADVEDLIQQGVKLIIINPVDSAAVVSVIESANKAGIPVITVDRSANGGNVFSHIASDNVAGGKLAGEYLLTLVPEGSEVAMLEGVAGSSAAIERGEGFTKAVTGKLNIVTSQTADFDRSKGLTVMENILQAQPNVKAVFAQNDEMALGALEAVAAAKKDIVVIGFDATEDAVAKVKAGKLAATVEQQPALIGEEAINAAVKHFNGENVEKAIPVQLKLVTK
ncbi:ribose ABC transporter substrate-binding protein RbsB [Vitreoscilla stercoraria]|uniref:Ribose ABC transporter substrate-binding protein RbsB n=1 Tax=Vitreoscilla stercoraria TaxID=61 RepID=A0ABY4EA51_VITST|nr:ribose ABC transporter substrate-binding protein RbsB [Vitreoscilla stercoraria]UOO92279.1 ribose ABC transporter substrate-binding protein RbsB [Vitreoscilla stercoraria]